MPGEVGGVWAEGGLEREGDRAAVEVGELEVAAAGYGHAGKSAADCARE